MCRRWYYQRKVEQYPTNIHFALRMRKAHTNVVRWNSELKRMGPLNHGGDDFVAVWAR